MIIIVAKADFSLGVIRKDVIKKTADIIITVCFVSTHGILGTIWVTMSLSSPQKIFLEKTMEKATCYNER